MVWVPRLRQTLINHANPISFSPALRTTSHQSQVLSLPTKMFSWTCSKCTYLNPPSQTTRCEICHSAQQPQFHQSPPPSSSPSKPQWSCSACTFLNPYQRSSCEICGTRASASLISTLEVDDDEVQLSSSVGGVFFPLRNFDGNSGDAGFYGGLNGDVPPLRRGDCGGLGNGEKKDVGNGGSGGSDFGGSSKSFSLSRCSGKRKERAEEDADIDVGRGDAIMDSSGFTALKAGNKALEAVSLGEPHKSSDFKTWKILSYNIWFREDLEMRERMRALGNLIELHSPDVICFQEVTPNFLRIFQLSNWWKGYQCSIPDEMSFPGGYFCMQLCKLPVKSFTSQPFHNSIMGRELCVSNVEFQPGMTITIATSHLESPCPAPPTWDQMFHKERLAQAKEAISSLYKHKNAIFCGDMNWDDKLDGPFPLPSGWADAWPDLRPGEDGWTYDTKSNKMLSGNRALQKRLDRFFCKLKDFEMSKIEMIGMDEIPGLSYVKEKKVKGKVVELVLPVLPSDHYGLLLTICPK